MSYLFTECCVYAKSNSHVVFLTELFCILNLTTNSNTPFAETLVSVQTKTRKGDELSLPPVCYKCLTSIHRCALNLLKIFIKSILKLRYFNKVNFS